MLVDGGGHRMAAGLTVNESAIGEFAEFLEQRIAAEVARNRVEPSLGIDGGLAIGAADIGLLEELEPLAPFGNGNAEPRFAFARARIVQG